MILEAFLKLPEKNCDAYFQDVSGVYKTQFGKESEKPGEVSATKENIHRAKELT